ncbi:MAG: hypothetical protein ABI267_07530 [Ginsengibacter sp.]
MISIETPKKTYRVNSDNYLFTTVLPPGTIINSIKLYSIYYDYRILPYDYHFNNLEYNYYLSDSNVIVRYADKGEFEFKIKSKRPDGLLFEHSGSLLKADSSTISFLKSQAVHDKNLRKLLELISDD